MQQNLLLNAKARRFMFSMLLCLLTTQLHENFTCRCLTPASKHESCQKKEQELKTIV